MLQLTLVCLENMTGTLLFILTRETRSSIMKNPCVIISRSVLDLSITERTNLPLSRMELRVQIKPNMFFKKYIVAQHGNFLRG